MASVYSTLFIGTNLVDGDVVEYAVPTGFIAIVRDITMFITSPVAGGGSLGLLHGELEFFRIMWPGGIVGRTFNREVRITLPGTTVLGASMESAGSAVAQLHVSGYLLSTP